MTVQDELVERMRRTAAQIGRPPDLDVDAMARTAVRRVRARRGMVAGVCGVIVVALAVGAAGLGTDVSRAPAIGPATSVRVPVLDVQPGVPEGWREHRMGELIVAAPDDWSQLPVLDTLVLASPEEIAPMVSVGLNVTMPQEEPFWVDGATDDGTLYEFDVDGAPTALARVDRQGEGISARTTAETFVRSSEGSAYLIRFTLPAAGGGELLLQLLGTVRFDGAKGVGAVTDHLPNIAVMPDLPDGWTEHEADGLVFGAPREWQVGSDAGQSPMRLVSPDQELMVEVTATPEASAWTVLPAAEGHGQRAYTFDVDGADFVAVQLIGQRIEAGEVGTENVAMDRATVVVRDATSGVGHTLSLELPDSRAEADAFLRHVLGTLRIEG